MERDLTTIATHLGKTSQYFDQYDPSLLVRELRQSNRTYLGIDSKSPPFVGTDTWNVYEVSGLTNSGVPVTAVAKFSYSALNEYIVESKSVKLYFGSFHMTKLGDTPDEVRNEIAKRAAADLSKLLETEVDVHCVSDMCVRNIDYSFENPQKWKSGYITLEEVLDCSSITTDKYNESPELLQVIKSDEESKAYQYHSTLLRSRCLVTGQPDSGDVYITFTGQTTVSPESLLKYIISFRNECHFHEEICEAIYKRLLDKLQPSNLAVKCLYARRGSVDINPQRATHSSLLDASLKDVKVVHIKTPKQ